MRKISTAITLQEPLWKGQHGAASHRVVMLIALAVDELGCLMREPKQQRTREGADEGVTAERDTPTKPLI